MSDITEETYPEPDGVYVRRGRCIYCGSKKLKTLYGYEWCGKPCKLGAQVLTIYELEHHLGDHVLSEAETSEES